jgi:hypothetical protein
MKKERAPAHVPEAKRRGTEIGEKTAEKMGERAPWITRFSAGVFQEFIDKGLKAPEFFLFMSERELSALRFSSKARAEIEAYRERFKRPVKVRGLSI